MFGYVGGVGVGASDCILGLVAGRGWGRVCACWGMLGIRVYL